MIPFGNGADIIPLILKMPRKGSAKTHQLRSFFLLSTFGEHDMERNIFFRLITGREIGGRIASNFHPSDLGRKYVETSEITSAEYLLVEANK